jgi:hypothetical protein
MGNTIAKAITEQTRKIQEEMQEKMAKMQMENMIRGQERQRRMMIAQQIAVSRELFWWFAAFYSTACLGLITAAIKRKKIPPVVLIPFVPLTLFMAYQWDFAYGNKPARIQRIFERVLKEEGKWYTPLTPSEKDIKALESLVPEQKKDKHP